MIASQVQEMYRAFGQLDYIVKVVQDCHLEQLAQAAQMRNIEKDIKEFMGMKGEMASMKEKMIFMEANIALIVKHLGIKAA